MKRIGTMNIKDILQHRHGLGLTRAQTATAVGVSTGTVSHKLKTTARHAHLAREVVHESAARSSDSIAAGILKG